MFIDTNGGKGAFKPGFDNQRRRSPNDSGFRLVLTGTVVISAAVYWSMIESGLALIAACLPTIHYLFRRWLPGTTGQGRKASAFSQLRENSTQDSVTDRAARINGRPPIAHVEAYAMNDVAAKRSRGREEGDIDIWVNNTIMQERDIV